MHVEDLGKQDPTYLWVTPKRSLNPKNLDKTLDFHQSVSQDFFCIARAGLWSFYEVKIQSCEFFVLYLK